MAVGNLGVVGVDIVGNWTAFEKEAQVRSAKVGSSIGAGLKKAMLVGGGVVGVAAGVGVALEAIGSSFDEQFDKIRVSTGQTGKVLDGLQGSFKNVLKAVPTDFGHAGDAISTLNQKLGLTGKPLEALSEQFLELSRITKTDLGSNITSVTGLFNQFGIKAANQGNKLDELFRASQATGVSVQELASKMSAGGVQLRAVGLDFEQSAALIGLLGKNGIDTAQVFPAISKALAQAAKEGKPASKVFADTFAQIRNAPNDTKAAGVALDVFGARAGPRFAALIRQGKLSYEDFAKAIENGDDRIMTASADTQDWGEKLTLLKNRVLVAIEPVATRVFNGITQAVTFLTPYIEKLASWVGDKLPTAFRFLGDVFKSIGAGIRQFIGGFTKGTDELGSSQTQWAQWGAVAYEWFVKVRDAAIKVGRALATAAQAVWRYLQPALAWLIDHKALVIGVIVGLLSPLGALPGALIGAYIQFKGFRDVVQGVGRWIVEHWPAVRDAFKSFADYLVKNVWPVVKEVFRSIAEIVGQLVRDISSRWDEIKAAALNAFKILAVAVAVAIIPLIVVIRGAWNNIKGFVKVAWDEMKGTVQAGMAVIKGIIDVVTGILTLNWSKVWKGMQELLSGVWAGIVNMVTNRLAALREIVQGALGAVLSVWETIWGAIGPWMRNNVFAPLTAAWQAFWAVIEPIVSVGATVVQGLFHAIAAIVGWLYSNVVQPIWSMVQLFWTQFQNFFTAGVTTTSVIFRTIAAIVGWLNSNVIVPIENAIAVMFTTIQSAVSVGVALVISIWQGLRSMFTWFFDNVIKPINAAVTGFVDGFIGAFRQLVSIVSTVWNGILNVFKVPVKFFVQTVYNGAIVPVVNFVGNLVGKTPLHAMNLPQGFATGGQVPGARGANLDTVPAMLTAGEYVITRDAVDFFGKSFFDRINQNGMAHRPLQLAQGGFVHSVPEAVGFAAAQRDKPYDHSGASQGPGTMDCSMAQSALINYIYGRNPWHRVFATGYSRSVLPGQGFVGGSFGSPNDWSAGYVMGIRPTSGGKIGHVIGRIGGHMYESTPPVIRFDQTNPGNMTSKPDHWYLAGYSGLGTNRPGGGGGGILGAIAGVTASATSAATQAAAKLAALVAHIPEIVSKVKDLIGKLAGFPSAGEWAGLIAGAAKQGVKDAINGIIKFAASAIPGLGPALSALLNFDEGGIIPGKKGAPRLIVAHGAERVLTPDQAAFWDRISDNGATIGHINAGSYARPRPQKVELSDTDRELLRRR